MHIELNEKDLITTKAEVLICGVYEEDKQVTALAHAGNAIKEQIKAVLGLEFKGEFLQKSMLHADSKHILLVGLGKQKELTLQKIRKATSDATNYARNHYKTIALVPFGLDKTELGDQYLSAAVEGMMLGSYTFHKYKTDDKKKKILDSAEIFVPKYLATKARQQLITTQHICEAINNARDLGNEPSNIATPRKLADHAMSLAKKWKLKCTVFDEKEIAKQKMGGLLAVSKGSQEPPRFIVLEHQGKKGADTICIVGKGITFDSGGISIKPAGAMDEMKFDMSGAGAVLGTLEACARLQIPVNVIGIIPTCENMPSGSAYKPGDIVTTMSGKTIEVLNTDAEGRVILSDGLHYASTRKPTAIFDLATLTGAVVIALGNHACGVMGNDQRYIERVLRAGELSGERAWQLPLWDEYREEVKSEIADIKNIGKERCAGTIAGAAFLEHFVHKIPWVHLDIAGVAWNNSPRAELGKGATGFGIRLLMKVLEQWKRA